jgi:hypothetical protein
LAPQYCANIGWTVTDLPDHHRAKLESIAGHYDGFRLSCMHPNGHRGPCIYSFDGPPIPVRERALWDELEREGLSDYWRLPIDGRVRWVEPRCIDTTGCRSRDVRTITYEPLADAARAMAVKEGQVVRHAIRNYRPDRMCFDCGKRWFA